MDINTTHLELRRGHITLRITTLRVCLGRWWAVTIRRICLVRKDVAHHPIIMGVQHFEHGPTALNEACHLKMGLAAFNVEEAHIIWAILSWRRHSFCVFFLIVDTRRRNSRRGGFNYWGRRWKIGRGYLNEGTWANSYLLTSAQSSHGRRSLWFILKQSIVLHTVWSVLQLLSRSQRRTSPLSTVKELGHERFGSVGARMLFLHFI